MLFFLFYLKHNIIFNHMTNKKYSLVVFNYFLSSKHLQANADVKQHVCVLPSQEAKLAWLCQRLVDFASLGKVLIFVTKKLDSEDLAHRLSVRLLRS